MAFVGKGKGISLSLGRTLIRTVSTSSALATPAVSTQSSVSQVSPLPSAPSSSASRKTFKEALDAGPSLDDFIAGGRIQLGNVSGTRLPTYLRTDIPTSQSYNNIKRDLRGLGLHTVCEEARCPNIGQCWSGSKGEATATIMLMGDTCTRACRFCAVKTSRTPPPLDPLEPHKTAEAIARWGVGYIVLTTVDRDDLPDSGATHFAETIRETKRKAPQILLEALTGDFLGNREHVAEVANSGLNVYAHNLETVERLTPVVRDRRAGYRQSLKTLRHAKETTEGRVLTKSSLMLGVGEEEDEIVQTMKDLREADVDVVTFGQYMRPTKRHMKVTEYVLPEVFDKYATIAKDLGFLYVASGPLVRSSFKAGELVRSGLEERLKRAVEKNLVATSGTRTMSER